MHHHHHQQPFWGGGFDGWLEGSTVISDKYRPVLTGVMVVSTGDSPPFARLPPVTPPTAPQHRTFLSPSPLNRRVWRREAFPGIRGRISAPPGYLSMPRSRNVATAKSTQQALELEGGDGTDE